GHIFNHPKLGGDACHRRVRLQPWEANYMVPTSAVFCVAVGLSTKSQSTNRHRYHARFGRTKSLLLVETDIGNPEVDPSATVREYELFHALQIHFGRDVRFVCLAQVLERHLDELPIRGDGDGARERVVATLALGGRLRIFRRIPTER